MCRNSASSKLALLLAAPHCHNALAVAAQSADLHLLELACSALTQTRPLLGVLAFATGRTAAAVLLSYYQWRSLELEPFAFAVAVLAVGFAFGLALAVTHLTDVA